MPPRRSKQIDIRAAYAQSGIDEYFIPGNSFNRSNAGALASTKITQHLAIHLNEATKRHAAVPVGQKLPTAVAATVESIKRASDTLSAASRSGTDRTQAQKLQCAVNEQLRRMLEVGEAQEIADLKESNANHSTDITYWKTEHQKVLKRAANADEAFEWQANELSSLSTKRVEIEEQQKCTASDLAGEKERSSIQKLQIAAIRKARTDSERKFRAAQEEIAGYVVLERQFEKFVVTCRSARPPPPEISR
jgi:hypothetical protein